MLLIRLAYFLLSLFAVGITLYLMILTAAACFFKKKKAPSAQVLKLAVVMPAHNEEVRIKSAIDAVRKSRYPQEACEILVVADNCDDGTAAIAREAGARLFERTDPLHPGKDQALDWFFKNHAEACSHYDGIVVLNVDTRVDSEFLHEISASLSHNEVNAVQGYYGVSNPAESWKTALREAALALFNHVRPAGRNQMGGTAGLQGDGMAFRTGVLMRYGWPAHSTVEDIEFSTQLLLDGILIHYNPDAIVYGEMAAIGRQFESQRIRWKRGWFQVLTRYAMPLLGTWRKHKKMCYFDGFMELLIPPLSLLGMLLIILFLLSFVLFHGMAPVIACAISIVVFCLFMGLVLRKEPSAVWLYLLAAPLFICWEIPHYLGLGTDQKKREQAAGTSEEKGDPNQDKPL